ncbi:MAG TPA: response regulator [Campylobacterales bacterium]|nr:response regulator [Campylobacterales bacterium]
MGYSGLDGLASKYSVLYVEDEKETRVSAIRSLNRVGFANIYQAENGLEGLAVFKEKRPQIVISDIQMPIMNGLEMVKEILEVADDTHVVLTTAFGDQEYFMRSIELKVDKYLMKPIDVAHLLDTLYEACMQIEQKKLAFAYLAKESQERLNAAVNDAMRLVMDASPYPTVIFKRDKLSYINDAFLELLSHKDLESIDRGILPSVFEQKNGYLGGLDGYKEGEHNKVCIKNSNGKDRIFELHKKEALLDGDSIGIYFLSDITLLEYQRRKLKLFGNAVQKELISKRFEEHKNGDADTKAPSAPIEKVAHRKIAALEYASEVDHAIFEQMDELSELENELADDVALFAERKDGAYLRAFAERLEKYAYTMKILFEFEELSFAIKNIAQMLYQNSTNLASLNADKVAVYCGAISEDLASWRNGIFVTKSAIDIHYLDDSLYSSCLQLEFELKGIKLEDDGGELELF